MNRSALAPTGVKTGANSSAGSVLVLRLLVLLPELAPASRDDDHRPASGDECHDHARDRCGHLLPGNEDEAAERLDGLSDEGGESDLVTAFVDELYQRRPSFEPPPAVALLSPQ